jgi:DNA-binding transcriptional LysR family regulator
MKLDDISSYRAFCGVAQQGNFAKASKFLGIPVSQVSKRVSRLEEHLGVRLFHRSTRAVSLSDEGVALLPKVLGILNEIDSLEGTFSSPQELSGVVKVTSVSFIANNLLLPIIEKFQKKYPKIKIELLLTEQVINIIEQNVDLAIRIQTPADTELIYRKLVPNKLVFCASPEYLKKFGTPKNAQDLMSHSLLLLKIHEICRFADSDIQLKKFVSCKRVESDNGAFLTEMALHGNGILVRSIWDVYKHIKEGRLVHILTQHPLEVFGHIHAVIPSRKLLAPRSRVFYEFVLEQANKWKAD